MTDATDGPASGGSDAIFGEMSAQTVSYRCHVLMVIKPLSFTESNLIELLMDHKSIRADEGIVTTTSMICSLVLDLFLTTVVAQHWVGAINGQHKLGIPKCGQRHVELFA